MAAATKAADVLHKTVATGLILLTVAGLADVTRGFGVLVQRNIDRRNAAQAAAAVQAAPSDQTSGSSSAQQ